MPAHGAIPIAALEIVRAEFAIGEAIAHDVVPRSRGSDGRSPRPLSCGRDGAVVVSLVAWRHQRRLAYLLVPITGSVIIATVYGRFHYVLEMLAGAAIAIVVVLGYRYVFGDGPG